MKRKREKKKENEKPLNTCMRTAPMSSSPNLNVGLRQFIPQTIRNIQFNTKAELASRKKISVQSICDKKKRQAMNVLHVGKRKTQPAATHVTRAQAAEHFNRHQALIVYRQMRAHRFSSKQQFSSNQLFTLHAFSIYYICISVSGISMEAKTAHLHNI